MSIKGTKTEQNILAALKGESMARNQYTFFEEQARTEGNESIADMFKKMAQNETTHAKIWYRLLHDGLGDSASNILTAAAGENQEWRSMYPGFAKTAREEGLEEVALLFEQVARIEADHEKTFLKSYAALKGIQAGNTGGSSGAAENSGTGGQNNAAAPAATQSTPSVEKTMYRCIFCGALYDTRPDVCPLCEAIGSFEETKSSSK